MLFAAAENGDDKEEETPVEESVASSPSLPGVPDINPPRTPDAKRLYRGGSDLTPRVGVDVIADKQTGVLKTGRGMSVFDNADQVRRFGGAYRVESIPDGLVIRQRGQNPSHYEIMPAEAMTLEKYNNLLKQVVLILEP
jgi:hypothetical protein